MENTIERSQLLGEIVTNDFRAAGIFKEAGIDFCCGGKKSVEDACKEKNIDPETMLKKLQELEVTPATPGNNYNEWALDFLCDYIVNTHHSFVRKNLPELIFYTQKIASVHGDNHTELREVEALFSKVNEELTQHMKAEEEVLFPAIKAALHTKSEESRQLIRSEIARMADEHEFAGGAMDQINELTGNYTVPADACNTYLVALKLLEQFEDDLHVHVHLENNILFEKALQL
ncbi:MAG: iron-sulfur cluster repair di-iron protein [Bacteroidales bacterium]